MQSRPWSKYSKGSSAYSRIHPEEKSISKQKEVDGSEEEELSDEAKKELLSNHGSLYVHIDWHTSHYVKLIVDDIFDKKTKTNQPS